jgi:hypothetical protein
MTGREYKNANNLFFLCSLIEYIGRKTKNHRNVVVNAIGILSEVYNSWLSRKIEDFNSSIYYESTEYLFQSYLKGENL